jgi:hypothetical protein
MVAVVVAALGFLWWLLAFIAWVIFLSITIAIARSKRRSAILWGILAVFFPLITIIVLLLIPTRRP